ncbi:amidohydrolase [Micropruina sp.]|uniref:amidohydrolase n=1 Tax=Micropruina sp. TaxID=2737536 RepID=UPI0039E600AE
MSRSLLLRRVRRVDLDGSGGTAPPVDLLIIDGAITEIGPELSRPSGVDEVDGEARWAVPGLWDAHVHVAQWVRTERMLPLGTARRAEDVLAAVAGAVGKQPSGRTLLGFGYRPAGWPRATTVAELDAVSRGRPVVLVSGDAHTGWVNSAAFDLLAAPRRTGPVSENEWFDLLRRLDELPGAAPEPSDFVAPLARLAALGVTGLVDFEFENSFVDWPQRFAAGADSVRVRASTYPHQLDQVIERGLRTGDALDGCAGMVTMGPLKIISDGSLGSRTAWTTEPYADRPAGPEPCCGQANYSPGELRELLQRATGAGLQVALHAIGDRANTVAIDAFEATGACGSIEHAQLIAAHDVRRLGRLGLRASVQPAHLIDDRDLTDRLWGERAASAFPLRTMVAEGVDVRFGSDAPVAALDPWLAIATAVHRSGDERPGWHPEQSLNPREALAASVDSRRLVPGSVGDVVLLDRDPLAEGDNPADTAAALRTMRAALTVCAGRITHHG